MRLQATAIQILTLYVSRGAMENSEVGALIGKSTKIAQTYGQRYEDAGLLSRVNPGHSPMLRQITSKGRDALDEAVNPKARQRTVSHPASIVPAALMAQSRVFALAGVWA